MGQAERDADFSTGGRIDGAAMGDGHAAAQTDVQPLGAAGDGIDIGVAVGVEIGLSGRGVEPQRIGHLSAGADGAKQSVGTIDAADGKAPPVEAAAEGMLRGAESNI